MDTKENAKYFEISPKEICGYFPQNLEEEYTCWEGEPRVFGAAGAQPITLCPVGILHTYVAAEGQLPGQRQSIQAQPAC